MDATILEAYGIDYPKGLARCLGDPGLYEKVLALFLQDATLEGARALLAAGDYPALFRRMHELKGASGNAAFTQLYAPVDRMVELLRREPHDPAEIARLLGDIEAAYANTKEGVSRALGRS